MLSLEYGIDAPMFRPTNSFGETVYPGYPHTPTATHRVTYTIGTPGSVQPTSGVGRVYTHDGLLYAYRSADIRDGDKFILPIGEYTVRGVAENDMLQPQDGTDFGVKRFNIERG